MWGRIAAAALAAGLAAALPAGAASADDGDVRYRCYDRSDGDLIGRPNSRANAKRWENRDRDVECTRNGRPVVSHRDRERERAERIERDGRRARADYYASRNGTWYVQPPVVVQSWPARPSYSLSRAAEACRSYYGLGAVVTEAKDKGDSVRTEVRLPGGYQLVCWATYGGQILSVQ